MAAKADKIFYGGHIITMEETTTQNENTDDVTKVEAVAIGGGLILEVGSLENVFSYACEETEIIFLNNQTLMPGFIECHQHAIWCAIKRMKYTDIGGVKYRNFGEISDSMKRKISELNPGEWVIFWGWDPELVPDLPVLSATYLDTNYTEVNPILVIGQNVHVAWANSRALALAGKGFKDQWRYYASVGFTTVTDILYRPNEMNDQIIRNLANQPDCPVRLALYKSEVAINSEDRASRIPPPKPKNECCSGVFNEDADSDRKLPSVSVGYHSDRLWEAGIKLFADGSPHCGTAAIREPYLNTPLTETLGFPKAPSYGILTTETKALEDTVKHFHQQDIQVAVHCHGERACEQVMKAYEKVLGESGEKDNRHRMEHCGLITPEQIARAGKLNLAISFFVDHLRFYGLTYKTDIFGDRVNRWTPLSEATKSGVRWTIHQDHPSFPGDAAPFSNMKTAITRCTRDDPTTPFGAEYCVSIHEALKSYTIDGAWQLHRDKDLGSIVPGKNADLIVLSRNPYEMDAFDLESIVVVETYLERRSNGFARVKTTPFGNVNVLESSNV